MCIDGILQITDKLEDNYSKDLIKSVIEKGKTYENLCIIGGGDLYVAGEIL